MTHTLQGTLKKITKQHSYVSVTRVVKFQHGNIFLVVSVKRHSLELWELTLNALPLRVTADQPLGAVLLALAQVKVESCSAARAEILVEAGVALQPAL